MPSLTLEQAETICDAAMAEGKKRGLKPLTIAIFDGKGALRLFKQPDPSNTSRPDMAMGKAFGAFRLARHLALWRRATKTTLLALTHSI